MGRWKWDRSKISETWRRRCRKLMSQRHSPIFQQSNQRNTSASTPISTFRKMPFHSHIPTSTSSLTLIITLSSFTNLSPFYNSRACCTSSKKLTPSECFNSSQKTRTLEWSFTSESICSARRTTYSCRLKDSSRSRSNKANIRKSRSLPKKECFYPKKSIVGKCE